MRTYLWSIRHQWIMKRSLIFFSSRRRHTRFKCDWSSDVCSSDLMIRLPPRSTLNPYTMNWNATYQYQFAQSWLMELSYQGSGGVGLLNAWNMNAIRPDISRDRTEIGRASCRERV